MLKTYPHAPAHLMLDDMPYFLTGAIHLHRPLLADSKAKDELLDIIQTAFKRLNWQLKEWVILDDHYHLLGISCKGADLSRLFMDIHGRSAKVISRATHCDLPVWWNYWDYCPRDEADYQVRQNYLYYNPVKHGYVTNLNHYPHSSFHQFQQQQGREALARQFKAHPDFRTLRIDEDRF